MKHLSASSFALALVFAALSGCGPSTPVAYGGPSPFGTEGLRVSGTAIVRAKPDTVTITLGKSVTARTLTEAKTACDTAMRNVIAALRAKGVPAESIQTVNYRLYDSYKPAGPPGSRGQAQAQVHIWNAQQNLEIRTPKVDSVAELIDAAVAAGADQVGGIEFSVASLHQLRARAREQAMKIAKDKAAQLAALAGVRLGPAVSITDTGMNTWPAARMNYQWAEDTGRPSSTPAEETISSGQVVVQASEEIVFRLQQ